MSKLLAFLICFAYVVASLTAHAMMPAKNGSKNAFKQEAAIHGCHAGNQLSAAAGIGDEPDRPADSLRSGKTTHCMLDFVILGTNDQDSMAAHMPRQPFLAQMQLRPHHPEFIGKPPKA